MATETKTGQIALNTSTSDTALASLQTVKYTLTAADFSDTGDTKSVTVDTLPTGTMIQSIILRPTESFTGGTVDAAALSVGLVGNESKYILNFDVFQAITSQTSIAGQLLPDVPDFSTTADLVATLNVYDGTLDQLTTGSVDIYVLTEALDT